MSTRMITRGLGPAVIVVLLATRLSAAQGVATLRGQVTDQMGAAVSAAKVLLVDADGKEKSVGTDGHGMYRFENVRQGVYTVRVVQEGFAIPERTDLVIAEGQMRTLDFKLRAMAASQKMTVNVQESLSVDQSSNKGATVIKGQDLDALPDDQDELRAALYALAGPEANLGTGLDVYLDGFATFENLPSDKRSIREIVINHNPFSAEYDRLGLVRLEISTRPGTGKFHGGADFNFSDSSLNSRNPYADNRPPYQRRIYAGSFSGPLLPDKISTFFSVNRREVDESAVVNATVLDANLNPTQIRQAIITPETFLILNPRFDFQLNKTNTMSARYTYNSNNLQNQGIGVLVLPSASYTGAQTIHTLQVSETSTLSPRTVNEAGVQYVWYERSEIENDSSPGLDVLDAFNGGGAQVGHTRYKQSFWELRDYSTMTSGRHTFKFGARLRGADVMEVAPSDFGGTYLFSGGSIPELDSQNQPVLGSDGRSVLISATSLDVYRRTLLLQRAGLTATQIRALGGGPTQLTISAGNPAATVKQIDFGSFIQDDWRLRPNFTLSMGLRYQNQTNIHNNLNFAPRLAFAWTPWAKSGDQPGTVIRGGFGIFYDLVRTDLALQVNHFNGVNEKQFIITDPRVLALFPNVPSNATIGSLALPETTWRLDPGMTAPYFLQSSISVEQSLPHKVILTVSYLNLRGEHLLRSRNTTAPPPATITSGAAGSSRISPADLPQPGTNGLNNNYQYESTGVYRQNLLVVNASIRPSRKLTLSAGYGFGYVNSDTDAFVTFPANSFDLRADYGRAFNDLRHRFNLAGTVNVGWGISLNPFVLVHSGAPFNITTGVDNNGDSLFTDRPAFATNLARPSVRVTPFGNFDIEPIPGQRIIPRNFGQSPGYFSVNLRVAKTFTLGAESKNPQANGKGGTRQYKFSVGVYAANLLNRTNPGTPIGDLSSPLFGTSNYLLQHTQVSQSANRTLSLLMTFNF